jgi:hypothetical protein
MILMIAQEMVQDVFMDIGLNNKNRKFRLIDK